MPSIINRKCNIGIEAGDRLRDRERVCVYSVLVPTFWSVTYAETTCS